MNCQCTLHANQQVKDTYRRGTLVKKKGFSTKFNDPFSVNMETKCLFFKCCFSIFILNTVELQILTPLFVSHGKYTMDMPIKLKVQTPIP